MDLQLPNMSNFVKNKEDREVEQFKTEIPTTLPIAQNIIKSLAVKIIP